MNNRHWLPQAAGTIGLILSLGVSVNAQAGLFGIGGNTMSWKEEVLLHDGQTIVVQRSQTYRGRFEPGLGGPERHQTAAAASLVISMYWVPSDAG